VTLIVCKRRGEGGERREVSENESENISVNHVLIASVGKK